MASRHERRTIYDAHREDGANDDKKAEGRLDKRKQSREICEANNEVGGHRRVGGRAKNESSSVGGTTGDHARQFLSIKSRIAIWCSFATGMM